MSKFEKLMGDLQRTSNHLESIEHVENAEAVDKAMDILRMIHQWSNAYPENIFIPMTKEDWVDHHAALKNNSDRSGSAAAADCMRYVVTRMAESIEKMS
jgi:hypothetical protein